MKLLGAGLKLPEDAGVVDQGSANCQDVFLLGSAAWSILSGTSLPENDGVPDWSLVPNDVRVKFPSDVVEWLARCVEWDPAARFADGIQAHDKLLEALRAGAGSQDEIDLSSYETEMTRLSIIRSRR
ncbi:hypothetical protein AJ87_48755 [Rhizobium yanglingense]|nr:hypothetical protein AJ87_48755 [Rhizobium yanglingense]